MLWRLLEDDPRIAVAIQDGWEQIGSERALSAPAGIAVLHWVHDHAPPVRW